MNLKYMPKNDGYVLITPPKLLTFVLCWNFLILFSVWLQPHTVFVRHASMIIGALLGSWIILQNWRLFVTTRAVPIVMIGLLLIWVTFHYFLIGRDQSAQLFELMRIWKKVALSLPFGIGLGISLVAWSDNSRQTEKFWRIIYLGFLMPTIVYFVKFFTTKYCLYFGFQPPSYLLLSGNHLGDVWGVSRAAYVFFCLPAYFVALAHLLRLFMQKNLKIKKDLLYWAALIMVPAIMFIENDRTGVFYCALGIFLTIYLLAKNIKHYAMGLKGVSAALILVVTLASFVTLSLQRNPMWGTLIADAKMAVQVEKYDNWKHLDGGLNTPPLLNDLGIGVSESNYDRIAWAIRGAQLVLTTPLGYGLVSHSFGRLNTLEFPGSHTNMTHSAWLDFTLGYGVPGFLLLFGSACLVLWNSRYSPLPWRVLMKLTLGFMLLLFFTKELSLEIFLNAFIFLLVWFSALTFRVGRRY